MSPQELEGGHLLNTVTVNVERNAFLPVPAEVSDHLFSFDGVEHKVVFSTHTIISA